MNQLDVLERQTDRQTETERDRDRQRDRDKETETERKRERELKDLFGAILQPPKVVH